MLRQRRAAGPRQKTVSPGPILAGGNSNTEHEHGAPVVAEVGDWTLVGYSRSGSACGGG
jgi:hypothetical protein